MIYYVSGPVTILEPGLAVIDCGGVGYGCRVTAYTSSQLKLNQNARLYITESIREDAHDLYGFISKEEQRCYELLTSVNGVGPKAAMAILSSGGPQNRRPGRGQEDRPAYYSGTEGQDWRRFRRAGLLRRTCRRPGPDRQRRSPGPCGAPGAGLLRRGNHRCPQGRGSQSNHRRDGPLRPSRNGYEKLTVESGKLKVFLSITFNFQFSTFNSNFWRSL